MNFEFKGETFKETVDSIPVGTVFKGKGGIGKNHYLKTENSSDVDEENEKSEKQYCSCLHLVTLKPVAIPAETVIEPVYFPEKIIFE